MKDYNFSEIFGVSTGETTIMLKVNLQELDLLQKATGEYRYRTLMWALDAEEPGAKKHWLNRHHEMVTLWESLFNATQKYQMQNINQKDKL